MPLPRLSILACILFLAACNGDAGPPPSPQEPDGAAISYFCAMTMDEHGGPGGQVFVRGREKPVWLASVRDTFAFLELEGISPEDTRAIYVTDMSRGWGASRVGTWIDARHAHYVLGSDKDAAMGGKEAVPFASPAAATAFVQHHGGTIVDYAAARAAMSLDAPEPEPDQGKPQ